MRKVILDCDPGHDDAIAILLAAGNPQIELIGVTTVAGNQALSQVTHHALAICALAGIDVPVAVGADRPLGAGGVTKAQPGVLDGCALPEPTMSVDPRPAVEFIADLVRAFPGEVHLAATGPLTNLAQTIEPAPDVVDLVASVSLMGGSGGALGRTPVGEFNVMTDSRAAAKVLAAPWPVTVAPLDLTYQAAATDDVVARIRALDTPLARFVAALLVAAGRRYRADRNLACPPVHDPCAVAHLIDGAVFTTRPAFVAVETEGRWTTGATLIDFDGRLGQPANAEVGVDLDFELFWNLIIDAIERLPAGLPGNRKDDA